MPAVAAAGSGIGRRRYSKPHRQERGDKGDLVFLERVFHKLLLNFTWWVNRKDAQGRNMFQGGFLGLDNIGVFDRSAPLPGGGRIDQADGTAWMALYCQNMAQIAIELAHENPAYRYDAQSLLENFAWIAAATNHVGSGDIGLWDEEDGFFYDVLRGPDGSAVPLRVRSAVGLLPLAAVSVLGSGLRAEFPVLARRAYLNAGTDGPLPALAAKAAAAELERELHEGRAGTHFERRGELGRDLSPERVRLGAAQQPAQHDVAEDAEMHDLVMGKHGEAPRWSETR